MNFYRDCQLFKHNIPDCTINRQQIMQFNDENQQKNYAGQIYIFYCRICNTLFHLKTKHFILCYPDPDPLINQGSLKYYGQRPQRSEKASIEPPDMELEQKGISALLFRERNLKPTHSEVIVDLFRKAIEHYKIFRSPRAESNLVVQMAEELVISQR